MIRVRYPWWYQLDHGWLCMHCRLGRSVDQAVLAACIGERGSPGKVQQERLGRGPEEAEERSSRRGLGDVLQRPRRGPEEAQERPSRRGLGDVLQKLRRGPRRGLGEVRGPSDVKRRLGRCFAEARERPRPPGETLKRPKRGP